MWSPRASQNAEHASPIRRASERIVQGAVLDLTLGNPDLFPQLELRRAMTRVMTACASLRHGYLDPAGLVELRAKIAESECLSATRRVTVDQIAIVSGAACALQIIFYLLLHAGDEVLTFKPFFPEYTNWVQTHGGTLRLAESNESHAPSLASFQRLLSPKTRIVLLNSPNNPSGVVYRAEELKEVVRMTKAACNRYGTKIHIVCDEVYFNLAYASVVLCKELECYPFLWKVRSFSKELGLAGERVGYVVISRELLEYGALTQMRYAMRALGFANAPALMQKILSELTFTYEVCQVYETRVLRFAKRLLQGGLSLQIPQAGFYVFPYLNGLDDSLFCECLAELGVGVVAGRSFGKPGHFRAALVSPWDQLQPAAETIVSLYQRLHTQFNLTKPAKECLHGT